MSKELMIPQPRVDVRVRPATLDDGPFIDHLQKMHTHMLGFMAKKALIAYIESEDVVVAVNDQDEPIGYCIARDRYFKRDDVGIVYQLAVMPVDQRNLIGATLVKAVFERAAYGCRLFCCWCAQDIQANWFWESIGFVPLAFRTGSRGKQRIHIFWQKRIREGDVTTPYWFPSQTTAGAVREDRLVIPIPLGTHWRDAKPVLLPGMPDGAREQELEEAKRKWLPAPRPNAGEMNANDRKTAAQKLDVVRSASKHLKGTPKGKSAVVVGGSLKFLDRGDGEEETAPEVKKPRKPRKPKAKFDPKVLECARELRDRYLEAVERNPELLPGDQKYDVSRALPAGRDEPVEGVIVETPRALPEAA